ncbi:FecR family protein [Labrenzia sp. OB1]|uniref:FecR family protein n=1 Tax=Labrenzia sp. OB1 TaxID=1561204 RepID=UPI0007B2703A|nr:FecR family protein [Labrenzia sp. OB1]KZM51810.1 iron dicitrate transport regulator FecR [Labrenzia sp. OB1]
MANRRLTQAQRKRHQQAADWVLRIGEAGLSPEELKTFNEWLQRDPDNRRAYDAAEQLLGDSSTAIRSDAALNSFEVEPARSGKTTAGTLLGLVVAAGVFLYLDGPLYFQADVISGTGDLPVVELEDGSTVHMNAESAIAFDYSERTRTIRLLKGEAFFEVAADPARPFTVTAGSMQVTALGTAFDVRLGDSETDVTVTHNSVLLTFDNPEQAHLQLNEGERVGLDSDGVLGDVVDANANAALAWRNGMLVLDNAPLSYVVEELERHFHGRIFISGAALANRKISGTMAISDTRTALAFLEQALGLKSISVGPAILLRD